MIWGAKRRKRLGDFFGDVAKIVVAGAVVAPLVQSGGSPVRLVVAGFVLASISLAVSLLLEEE